MRCKSCGVDWAAPGSETTAIAAVLVAGSHRKSAEVIAHASCPLGNVEQAAKQIEIALGIEKLIMVDEEILLGS
jgi:hypothetical protein